MNNLIYNSRSFKLWYFSISHAMLLIRSPKSNTCTTNIDICFSAVEYIDCLINLGEIMIEKANISDLNLVQSKMNKNVDISAITVLLSENNRFYVVSNNIIITENQLDFMELPHDFIILSQT